MSETLQRPLASAPPATAPPAQRLRRRPAWRDPRLLVGLGLVLLSAVLGARAWSVADRTVPIWSVTTPLAAGSTLVAEDLELVQVRVDPVAAQYVAGGSDPVGRTLGRDVAAGELLPAAALADGVSDQLLITVPVDASHAPVGLGRGDRVDVYVTPRAEAGRTGATELVLPSAIVDTLDRKEQRFGGTGDAFGVVLSVPGPVVERLVAGARRGDIDLVLAPGSR